MLSSAALRCFKIILVIGWHTFIKDETFTILLLQRQTTGLIYKG